MAASSRIHPISRRPMIARNMPIPAPVAIFRSVGIELIIIDLQPPITGIAGNDIARNSMPSTNTAARATCQDMPIPRTTANVKYAFSPIPGASANGRFAYNPITTQPTKAAIAVANSASSKGIPAMESMAGLTNRIYAIVRNVVIPALISPSTVLPASVTPNCRSNASIFSPFFPLYLGSHLSVSRESGAAYQWFVGDLELR